MRNIETLQIDRIIIHRVHKKTEEDEFGFAEYSENIFTFGELELNTLKERIASAFSKSKRFFKLEIESFENESFFGYSKSMKDCSNDLFIERSKSIADLLAKSHDRKTIPSGLLIIFDGKLLQKHVVLVIKAEIQEAFTIKELDNQKLVELMNDLFLSPAKDFYKIGYVIEDTNDSELFPNSSYSCYMYDDNFSNGKRDLAEYFYHDFLGFTTSKNDKLITKNFYSDIYNFIDNNVSLFDDRKGLKNALNTLYRENTAGVINPQEFAESHFPNELLRVFGSEISSKYPHSFTKDLTLIDKRLHRGQIRLIDDLKIEGPIESIDNVSIISGVNVDFERLKLQIESGEIRQIVTIKTEQR